MFQRAVLILLIFSLLAVPRPAHAGCTLSLQKLAIASRYSPVHPVLSILYVRDWVTGRDDEARERHREGAVQSALFVPRALVYPWYAPVAIIAGVLKEPHSWPPPDIERKDVTHHLLPFLTYLGMGISGTHPFYATLPAWKDDDLRDDYDRALKDPPDQEPQIRQAHFLKLTDPEIASAPDGPIVFLDGITAGQPLFGAMKANFDERHGGDPKASYHAVTGINALFDALAKVKAARGAIGVIEIEGHGIAGGIRIGNDVVAANPQQVENEIQLSIASAQMHAMTHPLTPAQTAHLEDLKRIKVVGLDSIASRGQLLAPGARIRFLSCELADGADGDAFLAKFASKITKQDVKIIAATKSIFVPYPDQPESLWSDDDRGEKAKVDQYLARRNSLSARVYTKSFELMTLPAYPAAGLVVSGINKLSDGLPARKMIKTADIPAKP